MQHGKSGANLRSTVDHHDLPELTFEDKTPQGVEHAWIPPSLILNSGDHPTILTPGRHSTILTSGGHPRYPDLERSSTI